MDLHPTPLSLSPQRTGLLILRLGNEKLAEPPDN
ncbi:hypothetical protein SPLC1_S550700 [Arthrospira platensis C1]|nr:hypothetical protein SPLC1_S550700 [Arthrospira platensis C1]